MLHKRGTRRNPPTLGGGGCQMSAAYYVGGPNPPRNKCDGVDDHWRGPSHMDPGSVRHLQDYSGPAELPHPHDPRTHTPAHLAVVRKLSKTGSSRFWVGNPRPCPRSSLRAKPF